MNRPGYCTEYGHDYSRLPCAACRSEAIAATPAEIVAQPAPAVTPRDSTGAASVIAALTAHRAPDARELAAGLDREDSDV